MNLSAGAISICGGETKPRLRMGWWRGSHRHAVAQLWGSFRVRAVGPLAQRLGQLPLLHGGADALLSGSVAAVQPGRARKYAGLTFHYNA